MLSLPTRRRWWIASALLPAVCLASELPSQFTLARYVPGDVWFYVHAVHNPERDWIDQRWADLLKSALDAGLDRELAKLFLGTMKTEDRATVEPKVERILNVLRSVKWRELCGNEFVLAERLASSKLTNDYIVLTRAANGTGEKHFSSLSALLKEVSATSSSVRLVETCDESVQRISLHFPEKDMREIGVAVELFRHGDVIGFASGEGSAAEILRRMSGKPGERSLVEHPRFKEALGRVEQPRDSVVYVDAKRLLSDMGEMMPAVATHKIRCAAEEATSKPQVPEKVEQKLGIFKAAVDAVNIIDYTIETTVTRGLTEHCDSVMVVQADKAKSPLAAAFLARRPFARFDEFIPKSATGFDLSAGVDLELIYRAVLNFLEQHVPEAAAAIAGVRHQIAQKGFDIEQDFFSWWSGECISVELPAAIVSPFGGSDSVMMFRVKDSALAARKVDNAISFATAKLQALGQPLMVGPAAVKAEGFREITHPALAFLVRPVIGVHDDWLMAGSSATAINKCLAVKKGEEPSIGSNETFKAEGLTPTGPVLASSFEDKSKMGQELAAMVGMIGTFGQMALAQIPDSEPQAKKLKELMRGLLGVAGKLGPLLQKIDFYSSASSVTTYDGDRVLRTRSKTTYKQPEAVTSNKKVQ